MKKKKIVTIGGGTGSFVVLSGLKKYADKLDITAIVSVADDGGSTGQLRDEFGQLPVGDARMALVALAEANDVNGLLRELFLYRFSKGNTEGHNFGNLLLVAMTDILKSEEKAIEFASKILRVSGNVLPVSKDSAKLVAEYEGGKVVEGEHLIDEPGEDFDESKRIVKLSLNPAAKISESTEKAILDADLVILGPGDLYTSTLANVVVKGVPEALSKCKGEIVYVLNLFTKYGQTLNFSAQDHLDEIVKYTKRKPDHIFVNNSKLPKSILSRYEEQKEYPIGDNLIGDNVIRADLLATDEIKKKSGDSLKRSFIRHDSDKLAKEILELL